MFKRFFLTFLIVIVVFSGFCFQSRTMSMRMAKAQALTIDSQPGCAGEVNMETKVNCCLSHSIQDSQSLYVIQSEQMYKKVLFAINYVFCSESNIEAQTVPIPIDSNKNYKSPPSLTGIIVKKE